MKLERMNLVTSGRSWKVQQSMECDIPYIQHYFSYCTFQLQLKLSKFIFNSPSSASTFQLKRNFPLLEEFSNFARFFQTKTETFQLQTLQLKPFFPTALSNYMYSTFQVEKVGKFEVIKFPFQLESTNPSWKALHAVLSYHKLRLKLSNFILFNFSSKFSS